MSVIERISLNIALGSVCVLRSSTISRTAAYFSSDERDSQAHDADKIPDIKAGTAEGGDIQATAMARTVN